MENKKPSHISEKDLDSLLNEAFLNLDFETNAINKEALAIVGRHTMQKDGVFRFLNANRVHLLFLLVSASICLFSIYNYLVPTSSKESQTSLSLQEKFINSKRYPPVVEEKEKSMSITRDSENHVSTAAPITKHAAAAPKTFKKYRGTNPHVNSPSDTGYMTGQQNKASPLPDTLNLQPTHFIAVNVSDSLGKVVEKKSVALAPTAIQKKPRPVKTLETQDKNKKVKVGKRRKRSLVSWIKRPKRYSKRFLKSSGR